MPIPLMRTVLTITLLMIFALAAHARTAALEDGVSPNHRYRVQAAETPKHHLTYQIVRRRDGSVIHSIETSYQPEEGELPGWSWNHSTEAEVSWSEDSRYVAIDEQVHHYIGEFLLVEIDRGHARNIAIPEKAMLARTRLHWDRSHIGSQFEQTTWASPHLLNLEMAGEVITNTFDDGRFTSEQARFNFTLRVDHGRATIASMEKD